MDERKLIYADDAIRWIKIECNPYGKPTLDFESGKKVIEYLERLPSAQPESRREWYMKGYRDAQDAALHESCTDCPLYDHDRHNCPRFNKVIPRAIEEVTPRWIPVTEAFPEEDTDVLVTVYFAGLKQTHPSGWNDYIKPNYYVDVARYFDGNWSSYSDEYKVAANRHKVVAWMPLPESYKEEQDEQAN